MPESQKSPINVETTYKTIRQEILDQKKCQFQLFSLVVTLTAAVLAYGTTAKVGPIVYIAPMFLNNLALIIIIDKAISIQRKVGYLKLIEQGELNNSCKWESHLDKFRVTRPNSGKVEPNERRKHSYVLTISLMLIALNGYCFGLYGWGPTPPIQVTRALGWIDVIAFGLLLGGIIIGGIKWYSLVGGQNSSTAINKKWIEVLREK